MRRRRQLCNLPEALNDHKRRGLAGVRAQSSHLPAWSRLALEQASQPASQPARRPSDTNTAGLQFIHAGQASSASLSFQLRPGNEAPTAPPESWKEEARSGRTCGNLFRHLGLSVKLH